VRLIGFIKNEFHTVVAVGNLNSRCGGGVVFENRMLKGVFVYNKGKELNELYSTSDTVMMIK
jgi:hypothetical protein